METHKQMIYQLANLTRSPCILYIIWKDIVSSVGPIHRYWVSLHFHSPASAEICTLYIIQRGYHKPPACQSNFKNYIFIKMPYIGQLQMLILSWVSISKQNSSNFLKTAIAITWLSNQSPKQLGLITCAFSKCLNDL